MMLIPICKYTFQPASAHCLINKIRLRTPQSEARRRSAPVCVPIFACRRPQTTSHLQWFTSPALNAGSSPKQASPEPSGCRNFRRGPVPIGLTSSPADQQMHRRASRPFWQQRPDAPVSNPYVASFPCPRLGAIEWKPTPVAPCRHGFC